MKRIIIALVAVLAFAISMGSTLAYSGFPSSYYPGNQYGHEYVFYNGPWGEHMAYGAHGYFPNPNGYRPYGYRSYGQMYSPWQMRWGNTMSGPVYRNTPYVWIQR